MLIGDKLEQGFRMLEDGKWEGAVLFFSGVGDLYMLDEIEEEIFRSLQGYITTIDGKSSDTEANQWLKSLLLDKRVGQVILRPGDLVENLKNYANQFEELTNEVISSGLVEGELTKCKFMNGDYFYIETDKMRDMTFLVRVHDNNKQPIDFDVKDFWINRKENRIEYVYLRGFEDIMTVNPDGSDKKTKKKDR